ncbi:unnamed protein product, partial [Nippostrongylus brasiliensis]|uniref:Astacin domain-containing protein n=1 Tax=Nippostrongylus brasiliensis TaxID=27835 RepID=A0A0N4XHX3_NIPBR
DPTNRTKRQAFKDTRYPATIWKTVSYSFDDQLDERRKEVFRKAVKLWEKDTCIDFSENSTGGCDPMTSKTCYLGFPNPRDCSRCVCPSGYGGSGCSERPAGCGDYLTATDEYQTLVDILGDGGDTKDEFTTCNYWIQRIMLWTDALTQE